MRRFEYKEGTSSKFWEIKVEGSAYSVRFGRIAAEGTTTAKTLGSVGEAQKAADKLIQEKLKKGYVEVTAAEKPQATSTAIAQPVGPVPEAALFQEVHRVSDRLEVVPAATLDDLERHIKAPLPPGYQQYITQFGIGMLSDFLYVFSPERILDSYKQTREDYIQLMEDDTWDGELGTEDIEESFAFGATADGDSLILVPSRGSGLFMLPRQYSYISPYPEAFKDLRELLPQSYREGILYFEPLNKQRTSEDRELAAGVSFEVVADYFTKNYGPDHVRIDLTGKIFIPALHAYLVYFKADGPPEKVSLSLRFDTAYTDEARKLLGDLAQVKPGSTTRPKVEKKNANPAEERRLINAILANPEDKTAKLAYADLLTKQGNLQGEFIRLSMADLPKGDPGQAAADKRWREFRDRHIKKWFKPLEELGLVPMASGIYLPETWSENGLITKVEINQSGVLPEKAPQLFAAAPFLQEIELAYANIDLAGIAAVPQMAQVRAVSLETPAPAFLRPSAGDFKMFLDSLRALRGLKLWRMEFDVETMKVFLASSAAERLTSLKLDDCQGTDALTMWASTDRFVELRQLDISGEFDPELMQRLAASPILANLNTLRVDFERKSAIEGLSALAASRHLQQLAVLKLPWGYFGPLAGEVLAAWKLAQLTELDLQSGHIGDAGTTALAASTSLRKLQKVDLSGNEIGDTGIAALANWPGLASVVKLDISNNDFGPKGAAAIAESPYLQNLEKLDITECEIKTDGAVALAKAPFPKLRSFSATTKEIGKNGRIALIDRFGKDAIELW